MNEILNAIKNRRSIRSYETEQIDQKDLDLILEAGIYAPTAHNDQPWHFTVIQNREKIQYINDKSKELMSKSNVEWIKNMGINPKVNIIYNAPTLIIVSGRKDAVAPLVDCSAAIENMLIAAESLNIGSVWLGLVRFFFELKDEVEKLGIPENYEPYYGLALGYKADTKNLTAPKRNLNVINYIK
ncbi:nitroreductase family protein [Clostridium pasteurianum DSM 525 = ATCC 6013]|uniref:Nitroreductase n=1 Tax=Clostridium pasteurianum DSM 525 = ATCC 6013 TaxID=1262449 RepID=A0A0H3J7W8_CLOPA|nr:nitroreductase family protein [Clostridium pasteurianum]AJA49574.1 nitroreductase family protein [Clostridium pasteurianum DSM 525 = ATCC 6013]AJA53562.1 nitroreductase family protein [Clostridium pasteurianum DSM 525 = ATCC 6013]AOZ76728.1 nitroreductase [Clostridium pasteurianum DSM 525 = ATCC 6013]AOZ80525.1 nitroreductase [Clostridium pasteurianum]ELP58910.1 nitroreductase [Clostridium pasteurianum DSM 525 = ATCC 6013]